MDTKKRTRWIIGGVLLSSFYFGDPGGRGLLNPTISDCCGFFLIDNFEVLAID